MVVRSAALGTSLPSFAVEYSGWKEKLVGAQVLRSRSCKPFFALATMKPDCPVVLSVTVVFIPLDVSWSVRSTVSFWFISSVSLLGVKVELFASPGPGGPAGTPFIWMKAKLTGSVQLGLQKAKLKC